MGRKKVTTDDFIKDARKIHGDRYDYSLVRYTKNKTNVTIICNEHGEFEQTPDNHKHGSGCPKCANIVRVNSLRITQKEFIDKSLKVHKGRYDYSSVEYVSSKKKVCITCPEHGEFWQTPNGHLNGYGCPKCAGRGKSTEDIIKEFKLVHGDKYDYRNVIYGGRRNKIEIICPDHGTFEQQVGIHLLGSGCPKCASIARSECRINNILIKKFEGLIQPEDYKLIPLTKGKLAKVDNEDFDRVKGINWSYSDGYAYNSRLGSMHRYILNAPKHLEVDHVKSHLTLDNRRENIRLATRSQNIANTRPHSSGGSNYKGVSMGRYIGEWWARITSNYKYIDLGYFESEEEAARMYDIKALELKGEFAYLNFPELKEEYLKQIKNSIGS